MTNLNIAKSLGQGVYTKAESDTELVSINTDVQKNTPPAVIIISPHSVVPEGFIECNGANISRITYSTLFAKIGTIYGSGDGSTTFKIPDLRGEFIRGFDNGRGTDSGRGIGSWQNHEVISHKHRYIIGGYDDGNFSGGTSGSQNPAADAGGAKLANAGIEVASYGGAETRPRNRAMMYCIKY